MKQFKASVKMNVCWLKTFLIFLCAPLSMQLKCNSIWYYGTLNDKEMKTILFKAMIALRFARNSRNFIYFVVVFNLI